MWYHPEGKVNYAFNTPGVRGLLATRKAVTRAPEHKLLLPHPTHQWKQEGKGQKHANILDKLFRLLSGFFLHFWGKTKVYCVMNNTCFQGVANHTQNEDKLSQWTLQQCTLLTPETVFWYDLALYSSSPHTKFLIVKNVHRCRKMEWAEISTTYFS